MVFKIIENISKTLNQSFPEYKIYSERVKSSENRPCFFIILDRFSEKKVLSNRYNQTSTFTIVLYINGKKTNQELIETASEVKDILEKIDGIDANEVNYRIDDDTLIFSITYSYFVYKLKENKENNKMELMTVEGAISE